MIARYSKAKPTMIFSPTRKSAIKMAQQLAELWTATNPNSRLWHGPKTPATAEDLDLRSKSSESGSGFPADCFQIPLLPVLLSTTAACQSQTADQSKKAF